MSFHVRSHERLEHRGLDVPFPVKFFKVLISAFIVNHRVNLLQVASDILEIFVGDKPCGECLVFWLYAGHENVIHAVVLYVSKDSPFRINFAIAVSVTHSFRTSFPFPVGCYISIDGLVGIFSSWLKHQEKESGRTF